MQDLAREFDAVIIGTGPTEALVSGALAQNHKTVINFDQNTLYGGCRRTFNIREFMEWVQTNGTIDTNRVTEFLGEQYRASAFCIDLVPSIIYSNDALVKLLIDSGSADSINITNIDGLFFPSNGQFRPIPSSKSAIFADKFMSLKQKRASMKFISSFLSTEEYGHQMKSEEMDQLIASYHDKELSALLTDIGFDEDLINAFQYLVAAANGPILVKDAIPRIEQFVKSIGIYSSSPFISFFYGVADIPQIFDRISAVYGGIFILNKTADEITKDENGVYHLKVPEIGEVTTKTLIVGSNQIKYPEDTPKRHLADREVLVTKYALLPKERSVLIIPPGRYGNPKPVWIFQYDKGMGMAETGYYVIHFVSMGETKTTSNRLLELNPELAENLVLRATFEVTEFDKSPCEGCYFVKSPTVDDFIFGFKYFIDQAREIVKQIGEDIPFYPPPTEVEVEVPIEETNTEKKEEQENKEGEAKKEEETKNDVEEKKETNNEEKKE
ncbi:GDP dissociation inhibitor family protein [Trichomonas vaginalis G3]|uniref:GDP dissociation inhibitor family protein n=1 Tax=Trichomonas vaginalis (strain ATCC PRA-98 / G3) TaxID=412133 RepID=A2FPC7_TRIV3|nr:protein geranylgeranylation [Trichomonas vaginalis G3]EAX93240.1 GDP dissociation inhibitor family protein [Trichomonas vaginalis G3]KAI5516856.1 protein geranylgeranylation [Trichomonas vaginalis G3]|eukprot:XP_001306170.1 GDP dissociation inhibitor family protein [Trichomonas vaginalis G3]